MKIYNNMEIWFITGSQHLYGDKTLKQVEENTKEIVDYLNTNGNLPIEVVYKTTVKTPNEATKIVEEANYDKRCVGVITWMHTFSPSKMWINGLKILNKPNLHLHTQFNDLIPVEDIDMNFMNLNQAAHGDREHGFINTRMRLNRKVISGHWKQEKTAKRIESWMRSAVGYSVSKNASLIRFGDNMRQVAVTEGDKVEAQIKFGWNVNTHPVGDLVKYIDKVTEKEVDQQVGNYCENYKIETDNIDSVRYQAKVQVAMRNLLKDQNAIAFTNTFEDLHGMEQLPGLATQDLMREGYGYGGEGDWKTSMLLAIMKRMSYGLEGGTSFMEDYTYHMSDVDPMVLGAHMLEVCPSISKKKPEIQVHPLGIGGKDDPARLVFEGETGNAIQVTLVDMGGRFRMIVNKVKAVSPIHKMPNLPVARTMWKPLPCFETATEGWILAGGAHHTVMSYSLTVEHMRDLAEMLDVEFVAIDENTTISNLKDSLKWNELYYHLSR